MFNLKTASEGIRKAAALAGIKSGEWEPITDFSENDADRKVARVRGNRKDITLTRGDTLYAEAQTWRQINR